MDGNIWGQNWTNHRTNPIRFFVRLRCPARPAKDQGTTKRSKTGKIKGTYQESGVIFERVKSDAASIGTSVLERQTSSNLQSGANPMARNADNAANLFDRDIAPSIPE